MQDRQTWRSKIKSLFASIIILTITIVAGAFALTDLPQRFGIVASDPASTDPHAGHDHGTHDDHGHDHAGHDSDKTIELSEQARANIGLQTAQVTLGQFINYIDVPAVITPLPGRTHVSVTSPLTGVINSISMLRGELINSGARMFSLRLTHQDLVRTQEEFLAQLGQLDVEEKELSRLRSISSSGAIAGKARIAREYERDKLLAGIRAARQAMLLHGLNEDQIDRIEDTRRLVREVFVYAPEIHEDHSLHHDSLPHDQEPSSRKNEPSTPPTSKPIVEVASQTDTPVRSPHTHREMDFLVTELSVRRGQSVAAGESLAELSDYSELLIQGHAFPRDAQTLRDAVRAELPLQATLHTSGDEPEIIDNLRVLYIGNEIDETTRALSFYVGLKNKIERSETRETRRYISWRYKPGQRLQLRVPETALESVIVVPNAAVASEGAERFVFVENGNQFERVSVRVMAQDSLFAAIANDGQVFPGQSIAINEAHELQMAMKNQSGSGIDPHAGHNH